MASPAGDAPEGDVATREVLDEDQLLGRATHIVCCKWQRRPQHVFSCCGRDVTGGIFVEGDVFTCSDCIEQEQTNPICTGKPWCVEDPP